MLWLGLGAGIVIVLGGLRYLFHRTERDGYFERGKTDRGVSFNWPGGGPH